MKKGGEIMKSKKIIASVLATVMSLSFMACGTSKTEAPKNSSEEKKVITMGSSGVYTDMVDIIGKYMSEKGYEIKLVTFDSNSGAADACSANELDAFIFNHEPWIKQYNKDNGTTLKMMNHLYYGRTAMYSKKYSSVAELPDNAVIAIPNDSTNMEQTLLFLQEQGLIKLGEKTESFYTTLDITENPKNISFLETEITYTARSADDCDAFVCTALQAKEAGMDPEKFLAENLTKKDYPIGLTVLEEDSESQWVKDMLEVLGSDNFKKDFNEIYKGCLVLF